MFQTVDIAILTIIPSELKAALAVLGLGEPQKANDGTNYWTGEVPSARRSTPQSRCSRMYRTCWQL